MEYFKFIDKVKYESKDSKNAMAWWHTLGTCGKGCYDG